MGRLTGDQLQGPDGSLSWSCSLPNITNGYYDICTWTKMKYPYPGKALVIAGERSKHVVGLPRKSPSVPLEAMYENHFSSVELLVVPEAGHWVFAGRETAIRLAIARYLQQS